MIDFHQTIDIDKYAGSIKSALLGNEEIKDYPNIGEIDDWSVFDKGIVNVSVVSVCIDWSDTRRLTDRVTITKAIYDAFCEHSKCKDVISLGEFIVAIFDTPFKTDIDAVLNCVGKINAVFNLEDKVYERPTNDKFVRGVGMCYGKSLLMKSLGGDDPKYCWNGEAINMAIKLSKEAKSDGIRKVYASYTIYNNLKGDYQKMFTRDSLENYYKADPVNIALDKWIHANV